jgi:poly(3-hydroxyoctanoate) depolymerase
VDPEPRTEMVAIHGHRIRLSVEGPPSECPLLLVSGIGAPLELWQDFRRRLGVTTIAFDSPGTGGSSTPLRPRSMWELAWTVDALLDALGYGTVDVLGISWGGGLAQHLALVRRARVRRLVLVCTGFGAGSIPGNLAAAAQLLTPVRYFSPSHLARIGPQLFGGEVRRRPELLREQGALRRSRPPSLRGYAYQLLAAGTWVSLPWLRFVEAETLVLVGGDDPIVHVLNGRILARALPNATLRVVPDAGHLFLVDQPVEAAHIVSDFLAASGHSAGPSVRSV